MLLCMICTVVAVVERAPDVKPEKKQTPDTAASQPGTETEHVCSLVSGGR